MCLIIFAHRVVADFPLLLAANRDEFYSRPSQASDFWREHPDLLAGKDLQAGGTWMGLTRNGRFAAITNFRDPAVTRTAPRSRGQLTLDYLTGSATPADYLQGIQETASEYAGFNLLLGDGLDLLYFSNTNTQGGAPRVLTSGIYGLSNASLDTPWPKVELGKSRLAQAIAAGSPDHDALATSVSDPQLAPVEALRGLDMDSGMDQLLSAQFIRAGTYGTRACTTLLIDAGGTADWRESIFTETGSTSDERNFRLQLQR